MKAAFLIAGCALLASAQALTQRGFLETSATLYPQTAPNDSGRAIGEALLRYEAFYKASANWQFSGGIDARTDTHRQTEREPGFSWWDRERLRPALEARRASVLYSRGKLTVEAGKQFIRWGKADILNPTDRFAPRDFLNVTRNDYLAVTAARVVYGSQANSLELVASPRLTPSRIPLLNQRWSALPSGIRVLEIEPDIPNRAQFGARWNHLGAGLEYSLSFFDGFDHLPLFNLSRAPLGVVAQRYYPRMRMYGGDAAIPLPSVTIKMEAAYLPSLGGHAGDYALYVVQLERQKGEWSFVGGYAGQLVTRQATGPGFSPSRGFSRSFLGRAGYTLDTNRTLAFEAVLRQNGRGVWLKSEYSEAFGQHWRATAGFTLIRGDSADFVGQFRRNSHAILALRYSF